MGKACRKIMYAEGRGVEKDDASQTPEDEFLEGVHCFKMAEHEKAFALTRNAAKRGHPKAQYFLGLMYEQQLANGLATANEKRGVGTKNANKWYQKSSDNGYERASIKIGRIPRPPHPAQEERDEVEKIVYTADMLTDIDNPDRDDYKAVKLFYEVASSLEPNQKYKSINDVIFERRLAFEHLTAMYGSGRGISKENTEIIDWLLYMAKHDEEGKAQLAIARMYANGYGLSQDIPAAIFWYQKADDWTEANYELGMIYREGKGIEINNVEAAASFLKAAQAYNPAARYLVGHFYREGIGIEQNDALALKWYRLAVSDFSEYDYEHRNSDLSKKYVTAIRNAEDAHSLISLRSWLLVKAEEVNNDAYFILGCIYTDGLGTRRNYKKAAHWLKKAAKNGDLDSQWVMGEFAKHGLGGIQKSVNDSCRWRQNVAEQDFIRAESKEECFFYDDKREINWLKKLSQKGNRHAQYNLAWKTKKIKRRMELLRQAAEQGNMSAQYDLGNELLRQRDYKRAAFWYHKGATNQEKPGPHFDNEIGFPQSMLGYLYREGKGVERDPNQAVFWLEKSLNDSNNCSALPLAMAYECGCGVERDLKKAIDNYKAYTLCGKCRDIADFFLELLNVENFYKGLRIIGSSTVTVEFTEGQAGSIVASIID